MQCSGKSAGGAIPVGFNARLGLYANPEGFLAWNNAPQSLRSPSAE